jgi:hypothetical protein
MARFLPPTMKTYTVHETQDLAAPAQRVWDRISNHAQTHTWVTEARVHLLTKGAIDENGEGAIRQVAFPSRPRWPSITEKIVSYSAPSSFSYQVHGGAMPGLRHHLGTLAVEPLAADRSRLTWHIEFVYPSWHPSRLVAHFFIPTFGQVVQRALGELARQMSSSGSADAPRAVQLGQVHT